MKFFSILVKCLALVSFLLSQDLDSSSLLDIGNEIQQLEKQYSKLPDLFKSEILPVYEDRLDNRLSINPRSYEGRIKINNPSYHWCMAKLYLLSNDTMKLRAHYARYLSLIDTDFDVPLLFKQPIPVTELMSTSLLQKKVESDNQLDISSFKSNQTKENSQTLSINSKENKSNNAAYFSSSELFDSKDFNDFKILSSEDFLNIGITSITDLIDYISGVNITHRGATESQPTIKYRGCSSNHFVFLIDGMQSFHSNIIFDNLNFPFDIDDLDYVEINTSPSSHKYGFSSAGVILNFVLKKYDSFSAKFNSEVGDYSHSKFYLDTNIPMGQSNHTISLHSKNNDGFIYNSDIALQKMLYRYSLKDEKSALNIMYGTFLDEHGVITKPETSKYPTEKYNNSFFNSRISHNFNNMSLISHTHWNESEYSYVSGNNINNYIVTDAGYDFKGERLTKTQQSTFGFSFARKTISNLLNSEIQRDRFNIFYNDVVKKGSFIYSDGFSANYADDFGWKYSYGIHLKYLLTNDLKISYEFDDGYKLPSFFEKYSSFGEWRGNSNIVSESVKTNEIGLSINNNILNLEISLFHRLTKNALDWEFSDLDDYWIAANIPQVTVNGHHLEADINVESIPLIKFISKINFDYTFLNLTHNSGIFRNTSNYLVHQFRSDLNYNIIFGLTQSWVFRYEDPIDMSSRWLVDTYFNLPIWKLNSSFSIENLLDIQYEDESGFEAPSRWMKFGLQFQY